MKIYTKTGDDGSTSLLDGQRVSKHNLRVEAYGTLDELNANLGLLRDIVNHSEIEKKIITIQKLLFSMGSILASNEKNLDRLPKILQSDVEFLEHEIDKMNTDLNPMTHFILPGGHPTVSQCHIARCICRRAERRISQVSENQYVDSIILITINRLSDYLFVLSRYISKMLNIEENKWIP